MERARAVRSEPSVEVEVHARLLARIQPARNVEAQEAVEHRHAHANVAQRPPDFLPRGAIAGPAEIAEHRQSIAFVLSRNFGARHPERIATLRGVGALATNGGVATKEP